jgi:hypothetical protein
VVAHKAMRRRGPHEGTYSYDADTFSPWGYRYVVSFKLWSLYPLTISMEGRMECEDRSERCAQRDIWCSCRESIRDSSAVQSDPVPACGRSVTSAKCPTTRLKTSASCSRCWQRPLVGVSRCVGPFCSLLLPESCRRPNGYRGLDSGDRT